MLTDAGLLLTVDVSRYQQDIDWRTLRARTGIEHAYIRVNDGAGIVDPWWERNASEAIEAGFKVAPYVFAFLTMDPDQIMDLSIGAVARVTGGAPTELPMMIDHEDNRSSAGRVPGAVRNQRLQRCLDRAYAFDPRSPAPIYSAAWYWYGNRDSTGTPIVDAPWCGRDDLAHHPLFQSGYPFQTQTGAIINGGDWLQAEARDPEAYVSWGSKATARAPKPMTPWSRWTLWQFSSVALLPGIGGHVDVNLLDPTWVAEMTGTQPLPPPLLPSEVDDMFILDLDGTRFLARGDTLTWINDGGVGDALAAALPVRGTDQRAVVPFFIDPNPGAPTYPEVWQRPDGTPRFKFEMWMAPRGFKTPPSSAGGGITAEQARAIVREELATASAPLAEAVAKELDGAEVASSTTFTLRTRA